MGKGDIKTKRGKIANKSYGVRRPKKAKAKVLVAKKKKTKGKS
jgi:30S ribosomal protein S31